MSMMAFKITSLVIVYSTIYSGANQRKHQSSASLAYVRGIHQWPVNSPHKWPVTRKMFPFDDVIMASDARDGIFQLIWSIPCLLMLLKLPGHQQEWSWLYSIDNMKGLMHCELVFICRTKSMIWYKMWLHHQSFLKQFSMLRVNVPHIISQGGLFSFNRWSSFTFFIFLSYAN